MMAGAHGGRDVWGGGGGTGGGDVWSGQDGWAGGGGGGGGGGGDGMGAQGGRGGVGFSMNTKADSKKSQWRIIFTFILWCYYLKLPACKCGYS